METPLNILQLIQFIITADKADMILHGVSYLLTALVKNFFFQRQTKITPGDFMTQIMNSYTVISAERGR